MRYPSASIYRSVFHAAANRAPERKASASYSFSARLLTMVLSMALAGLCAAQPFAAQAKPKPDKQKHPAEADAKDKKAKPEKTAYDYVLPGPDGKDVPLTSFKGKCLLVVNLGRKSGYNTQLAALEKDYEAYKDKGLVVIGVPSNDFGAAEPGTDAEIQKAYADAKVTFPVMAVAKLAGDDTIPFFLYMTKSKSAPEGGPVHWNYTKFFVDKEGKVVARLGQDVTPDSPEMVSTIGQILDGKYKPKKAAKDGPPSGGDDDDE